jgi:hypothetical protein
VSPARGFLERATTGTEEDCHRSGSRLAQSHLPGRRDHSAVLR